MFMVRIPARSCLIWLLGFTTLIYSDIHHHRCVVEGRKATYNKETFMIVKSSIVLFDDVQTDNFFFLFNTMTIVFLSIEKKQLALKATLILRAGVI